MTTCGSLFTGCGCADYGLRLAGLEHLWACEIEQVPTSVFWRHFPGVHVYGDVRTFPADAVNLPDVVWLSPPCQDLSVSGKRAGLSGERSGLFYETTKTLRTFHQRGWRGVAIMEQVPGLLSSHDGNDMRCVVRSFAESGARGIGWRVLDSQYFGVAQRRRRLYFVVDFGDGSRSKILFEPEGVQRDTGTRTETGPKVAGTLGGGSGNRGINPNAIAFNSRQDPVTGHITGALDTDGFSQTVFVDKSATLQDASGGGANEPGRFGALVKVTTNHRNDTSTANTSSNGWGISDNAHTLDCASSGAVFDTVQVRRLTPREWERLQGLPDDYTRYGIDENGQTVEVSDAQRYRMIGNGVTASVAEWIATRLVNECRGCQ